MIYRRTTDKLTEGQTSRRIENIDSKRTGQERRLICRRTETGPTGEHRTGPAGEHRTRPAG